MKRRAFFGLLGALPGAALLAKWLPEPAGRIIAAVDYSQHEATTCVVVMTRWHENDIFDVLGITDEECAERGWTALEVAEHRLGRKIDTIIVDDPWFAMDELPANLSASVFNRPLGGRGPLGRVGPPRLSLIEGSVEAIQE